MPKILINIFPVTSFDFGNLKEKDTAPNYFIFPKFQQYYFHLLC